jgi:hypothetical protein
MAGLSGRVYYLIGSDSLLFAAIPIARNPAEHTFLHLACRDKRRESSVGLACLLDRVANGLLTRFDSSRYEQSGRTKNDRYLL